MLASRTVEEIRRLLHEGKLSQRKIARRVSVSRTTVSAIAQGSRPDYETQRRQAAAAFPVSEGPVTRCPRCGGLVRMPCLACRVRALKAG